MCSSGEQKQVYFQEEFVAWEVSEFLNSSPSCYKCRFCQSTNDSTATRIFLSLLNRWSLASYVIKPSSVCFNMINERVVIFILQCFAWMRITIMDIQNNMLYFTAPKVWFCATPSPHGGYLHGGFWSLCVLNHSLEVPDLSIDSRGKQSQAGFQVSPLT